MHEKETIDNVKSKYLSRKVFYSKGTLNNIKLNDKIYFQSGYEINLENGYGSPLSLLINSDINGFNQKLNSYNLFSSSELQINENLYLRPGFRFSTSNLFNNQYLYSLSSKLNLKNDFQLRAVIGSSNRTPNYNELYTYFVDVNHNIQGNPILTPENGFSSFIHLKKGYELYSDLISVNSKFELKFSGTSGVNA